MIRESYERSALTITVFEEEDVIATSDGGFMQEVFGLFRNVLDNDTPVVPNR